MMVPAIAAQWQVYHNDRYGYAVAVPAGFSGQGEPDAQDGQLFLGPARAQISVWGGHPAGNDFSTEIARRLAALEAEGWAITSKSLTPSWASYSGVKGSRSVFVRAIAGCAGRNYAMLEFEYGTADLVRYKPVVDGLAATLKQVDCP